MAVNTGLSPAQVQALIQSRLIALRVAFNGVRDLYTWTSGLAVPDMETAAGLSAADAAVYLSAVADANAEAVLHFSGQPPNTYPQASSSYPYVASQAQVIGPQ